MAWIALLSAGILEVFWAAMMKQSDGFSKLNYTVLTILGMLASFYLLSLSMKALPISISYPIWTGIGAVGSIMVGYFIFKDNVSGLTWLFIILLVIAIVGIKITSGH